MIAREYIIAKIQLLVSQFPSAKCRYELEETTDTHIIEVLPLSTYSEDTEYADFETDIIVEFARLYPEETLCFISADSLISVNEPIFCIAGNAAINIPYASFGTDTIIEFVKLYNKDSIVPQSSNYAMAA